MPFRRGRRRRSAQLPHVQCPSCFRITHGRHADTNPGRKVIYHDENGTYESVADAQAHGLDASQNYGYGGTGTPEWDEEHAYAHITCPDCDEQAQADFFADYDEVKRRQREQTQSQADAEPCEECDQ